MSRTRLFTTSVAVAAMLGGSITSAPLSAVAASGTTRQIASFGTATFGAADPGTPTGVETPELVDFAGDGASADGASVEGINRSHSAGGGSPVGAISQPHSVTVSAPEVVTSFDGLNHFQNRFAADGGRQFSLEPPDQGLCVGTDDNGNTRIVEPVNDVLRIYDATGTPLITPQALNTFLGYPSAVVRAKVPTFGPFVTDPSCLYDAATGRWFIVVLTLDVVPQLDQRQHLTGSNHLDLAVSDSSDPLGSWTVHPVPVQDDGTDGTPNHHCSAAPGKPPAFRTHPSACLGDYPHIGSDANGIYLTTNEYSLFGAEFHGAQIYAFSKAQLVSGATKISVTQFDTHGLDTFGFALNGFTLWPSQTPGGGGDAAANGTEYFLSSNAGAEAHDTGDGLSTAHPSTQLLVWALSNTASLAGVPTLSLNNTKLDVGLYAAPPAAEQKAGQQPLRECLNNNPCSLNLEAIKDPFAETSAALDSNDTRMQQVTFVNGRLWGALDTALSISSGKQAGIEWFSVLPAAAAGHVSATLANQGYLGLGNDNLTYPAIGMTSAGKGVMAFTLVGPNFFPSAGYAMVDDSGVGAVHVAAAGQGPDDGFSDYKLFGNPPGTTRPRWGDYGAAVALGSNVWIASEYIGQSCSLAEYRNTNFRCGNTRTALANWDTRISAIAVP